MFDFFKKKDTETKASAQEPAKMDNGRTYNGVPRAEYTPGAIDSFKKKNTETKASAQEPAKMDNGRTYNGVPRAEYTPKAIDSLRADEVFVFGSNLQGLHGGGAAYAAMKKFGAVYGQGVGLQGQSYAIPTMQGGVETIKPYVDQFIDFAREHPELFFYVTRIGCGIAGFNDRDIAPLFKEAVDIENICLPKSFVKEIESAGMPAMKQE